MGDDRPRYKDLLLVDAAWPCPICGCDETHDLTVLGDVYPRRICERNPAHEWYVNEHRIYTDDDREKLPWLGRL